PDGSSVGAGILLRSGRHQRNGKSTDTHWRVPPRLSTLGLRCFPLDHSDICDFHDPDDQADQANDRPGHYRGMAACSRRDAINRALECAAGATFRTAGPPSCQFHRAIDVAVGRDDVPLDHLADLLSVHLLQVLAGRFRGTILDQYGSDGHLDTYRLDLDRECRGCVVSRDAEPFSQGVHDLLLGDWYLVDPNVNDPGRVAASLSEIPAPLRPFILGHGLSTRYVRCLHLRDGARHESGLSASYRYRVRLRGSAGLGGDLRWTHPEPCQQSGPCVALHQWRARFSVRRGLSSALPNEASGPAAGCRATRRCR